MSITSEPAGALVYLNDVEIGRTPVETDFTFFGSYDVRLKLDGYEPIATSRQARAPFYEYPGPDLIAEAIPAKIRTRIQWHFDLQPLAYSRPDADKGALEAELLERASQLREKTREETKKEPVTPSGDPSPKDGDKDQ